MQGCWQVVLSKLTLWLLAELFLNLVGLDTLADYSEYLRFLSDQLAEQAIPCEINPFPVSQFPISQSLGPLSTKLDRTNGSTLLGAAS